MTTPIHHANEPTSNAARDVITNAEPKSLRTFTPSQLVIAKSAGVFHWTPEGRRLYDFSSGVLVSNLGHNPHGWHQRFIRHLGWEKLDAAQGFFTGPPLTAYNAITPVEAEASRRLVGLLQSCAGGQRCEQVMWAASGSEAVQKALWAALARDRSRDLIIATRFGFHGKKGLAGATTGSESDPERDARVKFISFPMEECRDVSLRGAAFSTLPYERELETLRQQHGRRLTALITEPYLGGGGSYHPPAAYLQLLRRFCREHDIVFILDEVQSNFGRTGALFAFETYDLEPDVVILGKGLANGAPGAAAAGPTSLFEALNYGEGSDTYSGNPLVCAAVLATLESYQSGEVLANARKVSSIIEEGLIRLKQLPFIRHVRGEKNGMVWGVEAGDYGGRSANDIANACVLECYRGDGKNAIHLLGPLAKKVVRIAPPLVITEAEAKAAMELMWQCFARVR
jgi:4-aminobutyrate aminotransferase / (S)-3-amino-2-methylpropionate transaminase / 5-aminovalerate transaminase